MEVGLRYCNTGQYVHAAAATELVQAGEAAGFDTAWTSEHTVVPANYASPYPYSPSGKMAGGVDDLRRMEVGAPDVTSIEKSRGHLPRVGKRCNQIGGQ